MSLAAPATDFDKVEMIGTRLFTYANGRGAAAETNVALPFDIVVRTNGIFTVGAGRQRQLESGDVLNREGMLLKPDGTVAPVLDHVSMNRGRVIVVKDGEVSDLSGEARLKDGSVVSSDGKLSPSKGSPRRLLDGELVRPNGAPIPARDTLTVQQGKVLVQKDGTLLEVPPARSIMMNDGTKVFGDGTVVSFRGEQSRLTEGQVIMLDGVVTRPR